MRAFLFLLIAAVAVIMLWAIRSESYENGVVFTLCTLAVGLCGYLLADYFFSIEKKSIKQDVVAAGKEIQALKDEKDLLQTQFNLATPHAQVEQLEQQLAFADEQRNKLDGLSRAQYAEISGLKTQLEMLKKNYQKLYEESAIATETRNAELLVLQGSLASKQEKIKYLSDESEYLRSKILKLQTVAEEETIQKVVAESRDIPTVFLPEVVVKMAQKDENRANNGIPNIGAEGYVSQDFAARTIDNQPVTEEVIPKNPVIDTENNVENPVIGTENNVENAVIDRENNVENPVIDRENNVENPVIETENNVENAVIETENNVENPVIDTENNIENPVVDTENNVENAVIDTENNVENPVIDTENNVENAVIDTENNVENPVIDRGNNVENPVIDTESNVENPVIDTENNKSELTENTDNQAIATEEAQLSTIENAATVPTQTIADATHLQAIQGIDAETERVLKSAGIDNWQEISETTPERLQEILSEGNINNVDVSSWSVQAILLIDGHVNRLRIFLENLKK